MRILIVEDEPKTSGYLCKGLSEHGYIVDVSDDGEEGLHMSLTKEYDLLILDIILPGRDGWSILTEYRRHGKQTPLIVLTARDQVSDRVRGLELGADDYLIKPFAFSELLARIQNLFRRGLTRKPEVLSISDLELDFHHHRAIRGGQRLDLTPKEFSLLTFLAERSGQVLTRTLIAEHVWDINFDSNTNVIDVAVRRLRRKVDDPFSEKLIHTVRGVGYVLETH